MSLTAGLPGAQGGSKGGTALVWLLHPSPMSTTKGMDREPIPMGSLMRTGSVSELALPGPAKFSARTRKRYLVFVRRPLTLRMCQTISVYTFTALIVQM